MIQERLLRYGLINFYAVQCKVRTTIGESSVGTLAPGSMLYIGVHFLKCKSPFSKFD
jgi:hypothetical protein